MKKYEEELQKLKNKSCYREVIPINNKNEKYIFVGNKKYLNLSSNDYLGLSNNKKLIQEFLKEFKNSEELSFSSTSARLLTGNSNVYSDLENFLANAYKKEKSLIFNSGYHANIGIISALCQKGCAIFSDKLNHASIIDGMQLAKGDFYRFKHLNYQHLEAMLEKKHNAYEQIIIISESIFSMDGDTASIQKLIDIKKKYNAILIIDEAHSIGLFGKNGLGVCEDYDDIDLVVAPLGKAVASYGAFVAGNSVLVDFIINKARSFIFSTTIPPINVLWTKWILENKIPNLKNERAHLQSIAAELRKKLNTSGIKTLGNTQIVPIVIGNDENTVKVTEELKSKGYWVSPIRPPTVPTGSSRLRLSLNSTMTNKDIEAITKVLQEALH